MIVTDLKSTLTVLVALVLVASYVVCDENAKTTDINLPHVEDTTQMENGELTTVGKRAGIIKCRCWIGWRGKEGRKYKNFGIIRSFGVFQSLFQKQSRCSGSCASKCAPWLKKAKFDFLCSKIKKDYNYKSHKVGCFSKVGEVDVWANLWDFDGAPYKLCCKRKRRDCDKVYGAGYYYSGSKKMCLLKLANGCIPGITPGKKNPPVCCFNNRTYSCQKRKYGTKSVKC